MRKILRNLVRRDIIAHTKMLITSLSTLAESKKVHLIFFSENKERILVYNEELFQLFCREMLVNTIKSSSENQPIELLVTLDLNREKQALILQISERDISNIDTENVNLPTSVENHFIENINTHRKGFSLFIPVTQDVNLYLEQSYFSKSYLDRFDEDLFQNTAHQRTLTSKIEPTSNDVPLVLIINSQPELETPFREFLECHYQLVIVDGGQEGITSVFELSPDIIISDVKLHDKSGIQICWLLKNDERTNHIPFVLFATAESEIARVAGFNVGVDAYLSWPFIQEELILRLRNLLKLRKILEKKYYSFKSGDHDRMPWYQMEKTHHSFIKEAAAIIHENLGKSDFGNAEFAREMALSESHLNRKIKAITGKTLSLFIREIRLEEARLLLINSDQNISEIAYEVGFNDPAYFSRTFSLTFGISPSKFRAMFWR